MLPEILYSKPSYSASVINPSVPQPASLNSSIDTLPTSREKQKEKYASAKHEATAQFSDYSRRLAVRIDIEDFKAVANQDISKIAPSVLFHDPSWEN